MKKNEKNEELQSRREFFKKAAKGALPILGAILLSGTPQILNAVESSPMGCSRQDGCSATCASSCQRYCRGRCNAMCQDSCYNDCTGSCKGSCIGSCKGSCKGSSR